MKTLFQMFAVMITLLASISVYAMESTDFGPYEGKVVDADTKEPLEGVVVLLQWRRLNTGNTSLIDAQEAMTDENGNFHITGMRVFSPWKRFYSDARMIIYKSGYRYVKTGAWKKWEQFTQSDSYVLKVEHGKPFFVLEKFRNMEERKNFGSPFISDMPYSKMKTLIAEINKEGNLFGFDEIKFTK